MVTALLKRSLTLAGHKTSLALEAEFWEVLEEIADIENTTLAALVSKIDAQRTTNNMSSAVRLAVLAYCRHPPSGKDIKT